MKKFLILAALLCCATPAHAYMCTAEVKDAYAFATAPSQNNGAVFLKIIKQGEPDHLISATSPAAESVEIHATSEQDGVMKMRKVDSVDIAEDISLEPNGAYHIMLVGLKEPLKLGDMFPLTLTFQCAGSVETSVMVTPPGVTDPQKSSHEHHH